MADEIRSYHRAYSQEVILHEIGQWRPFWGPTPARGILWAAGLASVTFVLTHVPPTSWLLGGVAWWVDYGAAFALTWLCTVARIEGRRLHVALWAASRHGFRAHALTGAHRALHANGERWTPPRPRRQRRPVMVAVPAALLTVAALVAALATIAGPRRAAAAPVSARVAQPVVPVARPVPAAPVFEHPLAIRKSRRSARRVDRPRALVIHARPARLSSATPRVVAPVLVRPPAVAAPVVVSWPPAAPAPAPEPTLTPAARPAAPSCYPGELGC